MTSLATRLLSYARELRRSSHFYAGMHRKYPDRGYLRQSRQARLDAWRYLEWARAEFETEGLSMQSLIWEATQETRRERAAL